MFPDEMYMEKEEVVFKIHTKGYFEYDPFWYINGPVSCISAFTHDKYVFPRCLHHIMFEIDKHKYALFYRIPKKSLEKGLKLLHTNNNVHSFFDVAEEKDTGLRCSNSTPFFTRFKRKINKSKKTCVIHDEGADRKRKKTLVNRGNKGKEKVFKDEGMCSKGNKAVVTIYKRDMVNGKAKMVEDVGAMKTGRDRGVVIGDGGFNNVGGKEEMVSKRGVGSRKMQGTSVKVKSE
nr:hypothetical protein [Tanacetum cinerariifolium]